MTNNSLGLNTLIASTDFAGISITDTDDTILPSPFLPAITLAEWKEGIAVVSDNLVGVADHANVGKVIKNSLIPGAITYAQEIGRVLRETKEAGGDVASAICDDKEGKVLFRGHISDYTCETRDGFNFGEIHLKGEGDYTDEVYRIWLKNENIISYRNGEVDVIAPDLICMINGEGNPMTTPNFEVGDKMTVIALPSPEIWTTPEGLECFGPKHFGFDVEYKPFEK